MEKVKSLKLEDVRVLPGEWKNFEGRGGDYNPVGNRNFNIAIEDEELVSELESQGWPIKRARPRDDGELGTAYLNVTLKYRNREGKETIPPTVYMVDPVTFKKTQLTESTIGSLDHMDIDYVDLTINPYHWEIKRKGETLTGVKGYLRTMYVVMMPTDFADKYTQYDDTTEEQIADMEQMEEDIAY